MAFKLTITKEFKGQLAALPARERRTVEGAMLSKLLDRPTTPTNAIKRLRPNPFAEFELRAGDLRVLYNVEGDEVVLLAVGHKVGNKLIISGEEFHGHQDSSPEPAGNGPAGDAE
jgi:mRNA-degrading endonuclease RelE of RelBE toxin-antitoxin system